MPRDGFLNPFRALSPTQRREVERQKRVAFEAKQREEKVVLAYKTLVDDPRYQVIKDELSASLGELLHQLVETSSTCARCAPIAVRVKVLHEVIAEPLHRLFDEAQKSRIEPI